jgi:thiol-disulfide isomerase/thioredoxin
MMQGAERPRGLLYALAVCLAVALAGVAGARAQAAAARGSASPAGSAGKVAPQPAALPMIDLAGYRKLVAAHRGKVLLVSFWATWCEPCHTEFPLINGVARKYAPEGLAVVGVSLDQEADLTVERDFLRKMRPVFPSYRKQPGGDDAFIRGIHPEWNGAIPATAFYARDGRLAAFTVGQSLPSEVEKTVKHLLATPAR